MAYNKYNPPRRGLTPSQFQAAKDKNPDLTKKDARRYNRYVSRDSQLSFEDFNSLSGGGKGGSKNSNMLAKTHAGILKERKANRTQTAKKKANLDTKLSRNTANRRVRTAVSTRDRASHAFGDDFEGRIDKRTKKDVERARSRKQNNEKRIATRNERINSSKTSKTSKAKK